MSFISSCCHQCCQDRRHELEVSSDSGSESAESSIISCDSDSDSDSHESRLHYRTPKERSDQEWDTLFFPPEQIVSPPPSHRPMLLVQRPVAAACPRCGNVLLPEASLCRHCGFQRAAAAQQSPGASQDPATQFSSGRSLQSNGGSIRSVMVEAGDLPLSTSLADIASKLPTSNAPGASPLFTTHLRNISVSKVRRAMRREPFWLAKYYKSRKCRSVQKYRWQEGAAVDGMLVRGIRCVMPLPQDIPAWIARMVKVPAESKTTTVIRLSGAGRDPASKDDLKSLTDADPVVMVQQTCTHDAPAGENFRVQETLHFSQHPGGGTQVKRWVQVIWVQSLSWALSPLRDIIEKKTVSSATEAHEGIMSAIREAIDA